MVVQAGVLRFFFLREKGFCVRTSDDGGRCLPIAPQEDDDDDEAPPFEEDLRQGTHLQPSEGRLSPTSSSELINQYTKSSYLCPQALHFFFSYTQ